MRRNLRIVLLLIRLKLSRMLMYRADFFTAFFADGVLFLVQLLAFETIYSQVDSIGGWGRGQMIVFVGTFSMINALNMLIYAFGLMDLPGMIRRGDLDQYLTKPVNPLLRLSFEQVNPGSAPLVLLSLGIVGYGLRVAGIQPSFGQALVYALLVLLMTLLWYDMLLILRTLTFFWASATGIHQLEESLLELCFKVPGVLLNGFAKVLLCFIVPYGIMSTAPTQWITNHLDGPGLLTAMLVVFAFTALAMRLWKLGLKHYKSASS